MLGQRLPTATTTKTVALQQGKSKDKGAYQNKSLLKSDVLDH
jgi:hypothetical protein